MNFKLQRKKSTRERNKKLGLGELIWFGFNYTAGIAFTANFSALILSEQGEASGNVGGHLIWIFLVEGIIAGICAWAYNRLSRIHPQGNGASYVYTRANYGKFASWIVSFIQYTTLPIIVTSQIVSMIRINFTDPNSFLYANWGQWTNFYLDLIGIGIYAIASCAVFFGMKWFKRLVNISGFLKWGSTILLIVFVIVLFGMSGTANFSNTMSHSTITPDKFSKAFTSCFFFFLGFETYSTISKNVKNPEKNIGKSVIWVMIITTLFYVVTIILFIGGLASFGSNPNLSVFETFGMKINAHWFGILGAVIMLICTISLKANAGMQNALYSGGILEPQAIENFIPTRFKDLNKDGIPFRASLLNLIITFIFVAVWLILPDIIYSIHPTSGDQITYDAITGEASLIEIVIYAVVISIALKLSFQKKMRANWLEKIAWIVVFIFLVWQFVEFFIDIAHSYQIGKVVSTSIELGYICLVFAFGVIWYFAYYYPRYKKRLVTNPNVQATLDNEFRVIDDWNYLINEMNDKIDNYLIRNNKIHNAKPNDNEAHASQLKQHIYHHWLQLKKASDEPEHNEPVVE